MDKVETYIEGIKRLTKIDGDVCKILDELNNLIKEVLKREICELDIPSEYKLWINIIVENWRCPLKWEIRANSIPSFAQNERNEYVLKIDVHQQLLMYSGINEIRACISTMIGTIQGLCDSKYMLCNERVVLKKLYGLYTDLPVEDGEDLKKIITKYSLVELKL